MKELINTNSKVYPNIWNDADDNLSLYSSDWLVLFISYVNFKKNLILIKTINKILKTE